jgi:hypothetical protein
MGGTRRPGLQKCSAMSDLKFEIEGNSAAIGTVLARMLDGQADFGLGDDAIPDYLIRLKEPEGGEANLILEIKGLESEQDRAKKAAAQKWVRAVNNLPDRPYGKWGYVVCKNPHQVRQIVDTWVG